MQEIELTSGERRGLALYQNLSGVRVYAQPVEPEHLLIYISGRFLHAPQDCGDPSGQLSRAERLHDIVVCAKSETYYALLLLAARGEHDQGHPPFGLHAATHFQAAQLR